MLSQLSYTPGRQKPGHQKPGHQKPELPPVSPLMRTRGFEPRTSSLSATRSNQLSYVREAQVCYQTQCQSGRASLSIRFLMSTEKIPRFLRDPCPPVPKPCNRLRLSAMHRPCNPAIFNNSSSFPQAAPKPKRWKKPRLPSVLQRHGGFSPVLLRLKIPCHRRSISRHRRDRAGHGPKKHQPGHNP